jgi:hypothetical protein
VLAAALLAAACAACGVVSEHPLSDERTSVLDADLVGVWEADAEEDDEAAPRFFVGHAPDKANTLEVVFLQLDRDEEGVPRVRVERLLLFTTSLGERRWLSVGRRGEGFLIATYDLEAEAALRLRGLDEDAVAQAIGDGALAGTVEVEKGDLLVPDRKKVRIQAQPKDLAAWLRDHPETLVAPEKAATFHRVALGDLEEDATGSGR